METPVFDINGKEVGKAELPEKIFGVKVSPGLLHEVTTAHLSNQRSGTAHTKTRAEVRGGGRKPWRQKHTGRSRQGSNRSPIWRKGGVVFGPRSKSWRREMPRRKGHQALAQALTARVNDESLRVVEELSLDGAKSSQVSALLKALKAHPKSLLVTEGHDANLVRASRNVKGVKVALVSNLNAYDVLACRNLIITRKALEKLGPRWN